MKYRRLAWLFAASACHGPSPDDGCEQLCAAARACGFLPSGLGEGEGEQAERNCQERCALSDAALRDEIGPALPAERPTGEGLAAWCTGDGTPACAQLASVVRETIGGEHVLGVATARVQLHASPSETGECGPEPRTACRPNLTACVVDDTTAVARPCTEDGDEYASARGTPYSSVPWCALVGADTTIVRLAAWNGTEQTRELRCPDAVNEAITFADLEPGPAQATLEIRGRYPERAILATDDEGIAAAVPLTPGLGLQGEYCWSISSALTQLSPGSMTAIPLLLPRTGLHAIARAWRQADADAKGTGEILLLRCEATADACLDGLDDDGDGLIDCQDSGCAAYCDDRERGADVCANGSDDDGDGLTDCEDPGCALFCENGERECRDGLDNDGDGTSDCADESCARVCDRRFAACGDDCPEVGPGEVAVPSCEGGPPEVECSGNPKCAWVCGRETDCTDRVDDDADGLTDDADPDCTPRRASALACVDGLDDELPLGPDACTSAVDAEDPCCRREDDAKGCDDDGATTGGETDSVVATDG